MGKHFSNKHFSKKRRRNVRSLETAEIIEFQSSKFEFERSDTSERWEVAPVAT